MKRKKLICFMIAATLVFSSFSVAYAKQGNSSDQKGKKQTVQQVMNNNKKQTVQQVKDNNKEQPKVQSSNKITAPTKEKINHGKAYGKKQSFKLDGSPVIKYGKYKVPIRPITKGMGATYAFDKMTGILTITKDTTSIAISFKDKKVLVNGVEDTKSGVFTSKGDKAKQILRYIADKLGVRLTFSKDKVTTEAPEDEDAPSVTAVTSAAISVSGSSITVNVTGAGAVNDKVDVTKLSLTDTSLNKTYQLTDSTGIVSSDSSLFITLSPADLLGLAGFEGTDVTLNVAAGSLLSDTAGNVSTAFTAVQTVPVTVTQ